MSRSPSWPAGRLQWELSGAGLQNLALRERPVPSPGAEELLVRIDACGICFSDIKILRLGGEHPRLQGRDLERDPVVMGHEVAMTVMQVGEARRAQFQPGQRFLIQADIIYRGEGLAFGYKLAGGYSQYQLIGPEVLDGDEGCYLLPVSRGVGYSQAALAEPWACVEASYACAPRTAPQPGGSRLVVVAANADRAPEAQPWPDDRASGRELQVDGSDADAPQLIAEHAPYDDVLFWGAPAQAIVDAVTGCLEKGAVIRWERVPAGVRRALDVGSIHYRGHWHVSTPESGSGDAYAWPRGAEMTPGGQALFIGAGGPLGQMQLQRTFALPAPPAHVVVSQRSGPRLEHLRQTFEPLAKAKGVRFTLLDARALGDEVYTRAREATGGAGFDDIVVVVPNARVVEQVVPLAAAGGGVNLFAGIGVGTKASIPLDCLRQGVRLWGTTGSTIADLRRIVEKVESGALDTDSVVAAVGGIRAVCEGLEAVRDGRFLGKTVIYPQLERLPLTTVEDLAAQHPSLAERLGPGGAWNSAAEAELLRLYQAGAK